MEGSAHKIQITIHLNLLNWINASFGNAAPQPHSVPFALFRAWDDFNDGKKNAPKYKRSGSHNAWCHDSSPKHTPVFYYYDAAVERVYSI
jgi:hypothetical protein